MVLDCLLGYAQFGRNLLIPIAPDHQRRDLPFSRRPCLAVDQIEQLGRFCSWLWRLRRAMISVNIVRMLDTALSFQFLFHHYSSFVDQPADLGEILTLQPVLTEPLRSACSPLVLKALVPVAGAVARLAQQKTG